MRKGTRILVAALLASPLGAQVFEEHFHFPNGALVPGWTQEVGTWVIKNGRLAGTGPGWRFITKANFLAADCVLDGTFFFTGKGVQFGGLAARQPGKGSSTNLVLGKIQNNWGRKGFDQAYLYELPQNHVYTNLAGRGALSVELRLILLGGNAWLRLDTDRDGLYDSTLGPLALSHVKGPGLIGLASYGPTEMDDFKFYDAVLMEVPGSVPRIGTTYRMRFRAPPSRGWGFTPYLCFITLSNQGIPLKARKIPLAPDPMILFSLFFPQVFHKFLGILDKNGDAFPEIRIPNDPSLVGSVLYVAGITLDPLKPYAIGAISNDHRIRIR